MEIVVSIAGKQAEEIVNLLDGEKYVNEFIIAKKLNLTINQTRNILYKISDDLFRELNRKQWNDKEILSKLNKLFIACPTPQEFQDIFELTEKLIAIINKIDLIGIKLEEHKKEIEKAPAIKAAEDKVKVKSKKVKAQVKSQKLK